MARGKQMTALRVLGAALIALSAPNGRAQSADSGIPGVLLSRQLIEARHLSVGDVVGLSADSSGSHPRPFRIVGVYEPTPDPMRFAQPALEARLHLPDLLAFSASTADGGAWDTVSSINVALANPSDALAFARDVAARVPGALATPT